MANTYTWYTDMNVPIADSTSVQNINKSFAWGLKALLKGEVTGSRGINGAAPSSSYWTCELSSDGTSRSTSDLWGSSYDSSKINYLEGNSHNFTGSHSWIVLRSPSGISSAGYLYFLLCYAGPTNGESDGYIGAFISNTPFGGGSSSLRPTSSNEVSIRYSFSSYMDVGLGPNTTGDYKIHLCRTSNGQFWFAGSKNTTGKFGRVVGIGATTETRSPETQPWYVFWDKESNGFNTLAHFQLADWGNNVYNVSRTHNNLYKTELLPLRPYSGNESHTVLDSFNRSSTNVQGDLDAFPLYLLYKGSTQAVAGASVGIKGKVEDVFISSHLPGAVYPTSGDVEKVCVGGLWLPYDVAPEL